MTVLHFVKEAGRSPQSPDCRQQTMSNSLGLGSNLAPKNGKPLGELAEIEKYKLHSAKKQNPSRFREGFVLPRYSLTSRTKWYATGLPRQQIGIMSVSARNLLPAFRLARKRNVAGCVNCAT